MWACTFSVAHPLPKSALELVYLLRKVSLLAVVDPNAMLYFYNSTYMIDK